MHFTFTTTILTILALLLTLTNAAPTLTPPLTPRQSGIGLCTSFLPAGQCTLLTIQYSGTENSGVYLYDNSCHLIGGNSNVFDFQTFNFDSQLPYVIVLDNLALRPSFRYGAGYWDDPDCFEEDGQWWCVFHWQCA